MEKLAKMKAFKKKKKKTEDGERLPMTV